MKYILLLSLFTTSAMANIHTRNLWKHNEVTTCFGQAEEVLREEGPYVLKVRDWKDKEKEKLKAWVLEEYSPERTGIFFTGFEDCENAPDADVIIFKNKNSKFKAFFAGALHGLALLGPYFGEVAGYPKASSFVSISSTGMDKGTVIHEFGHVAGLAHEHEHPNAWKEDPKRCSSIKENTFPKFRLEYEPYDRDSVMNYCKIHGKEGKKLGLSPGDVALLRKLYP
jgi:hypothetical protein